MSGSFAAERPRAPVANTAMVKIASTNVDAMENLLQGMERSLSLTSRSLNSAAECATKRTGETQNSG